MSQTQSFLLVPPWPSFCSWAESRFSSCGSGPLNVSMAHVVPLPPCVLLACWGPHWFLWNFRSCLLAESWPNFPHPPFLSLWFHFWGQSTSIVVSVPQHCPTLVSTFCKSYSLSCPPHIASRDQQTPQQSLEQVLKVWREQRTSWG